MAHPLVDQLRFTRSEFRRALAGVTDDEADRRFPPMNSIGWIVGHLAAQEQFYWLTLPQGNEVVPGLRERVGYRAPASTPPLDEMWAGWEAVTAATDPWLDTLTSETLQEHFIADGERWGESIGSMLRRVTYHYWYHTGESQAIRQLLGHTNLPEFVGDIHDEAPYRPE